MRRPCLWLDTFTHLEIDEVPEEPWEDARIGEGRIVEPIVEPPAAASVYHPCNAWALSLPAWTSPRQAPAIRPHQRMAAAPAWPGSSASAPSSR